MNGPAELLSVLEKISTDRVKAGDIGGIDKTLINTVRELKQAQALHQKASDDYTALAQSARELDAKCKQCLLKLYEARILAYNESIDNPAADVKALAAQLLPMEREVELIQDSRDSVTHVRLPEALDRKQETGRDEDRLKHLESALYTARSQATMLEKLERAGFFESHGRVAAVSETTLKLKMVTAECYRQAQLSEQQLTDQRAARITLTAARRASGQITRAEATFAALEIARSTSTIE